MHKFKFLLIQMIMQVLENYLLEETSVINFVQCSLTSLWQRRSG
jgi:hypothetical protein